MPQKGATRDTMRRHHEEMPREILQRIPQTATTMIYTQEIAQNDNTKKYLKIYYADTMMIWDTTRIYRTFHNEQIPQRDTTRRYDEEIPCGDTLS
jgi:hypothetical protein